MLARPFRFATAVAIAALFTASNARADIVNVTGIGAGAGPASFTGSIEIIPGSNTSATLVVTLTNTSSGVASAGYITGFGLNDPNSFSNGNISVSNSGTALTSSPNGNFQTVKFSNADLGGIYGQYDFGASVGSTLHTSGAASDGLAVGETGVFTFSLVGSGLNNLTTTTLLNEMSSGASQPNPFAVRFRGYNGGRGYDGDKVPVKTITTPPNNPVPAPPGVLLAGVGVVCCVAGRIRRSRSTPTV